MLEKKGTSFKDFGHIITYRPLYTHTKKNKYQTDFFMPYIDKKETSPVSNLYTPIQTEPIVDQVMDIIKKNKIKSKGIVGQLVGRQMVAHIALDEPQLVKNGKKIEHDFLPEVAKELDYTFNGGDDIVNLSFAIVNSYDGEFPLIGFFQYNRVVCANGMVVSQAIKQATLKHIGMIGNRFEEFFKQVFTDTIERFNILLHKKDKKIDAKLLFEIIDYLLKQDCLKRSVNKLLVPYQEKKEDIKLWALYNLVTYMISRSTALQNDVRRRLAVHRAIFTRLMR